MSRTVELVLGIVGITMFFATLAAIPWLVRRLPHDYFVRRAPPRSRATKVIRNVVGGLLVVAGVAMLVLPGQGVVTILLGLSVVDLPVKDRLVRRLLQQRRIHDGIQRVRARAGKRPLLVPTAT